MTDLHHCRTVLLAEGWARDMVLEIDPAEGTIRGVGPLLDGTRPDFRHDIVVPGMPNGHSHAFQRAMAGLAERRGPSADSFWTWRQIMYGFLGKLTPDHVHAIAAQVYAEMLSAGFTTVAEFHYLHHQPGGTPYDDIGEMAGAIARAASETGIRLTLLPVFYGQSDFGGAPLSDRQQRFGNEPDRYARLVERCREIIQDRPGDLVGIAPHSLRAAGPDHLQAILPLAGDGPVHIHISEQVKEVADCQSWSGARPIQWLLANAPVGPGWSLIHATHADPDEIAGIAASGAVAGLCPITEANLGDGIFPAPGYLAAGGRFSIGSDSNVRIDLAEELRTLEYGQRLRDLARNVLAPPDASTGRALFDGALAGGCRAVGGGTPGLRTGGPADFSVLDAAHPALAGRREDALLDGWIFAGDDRCVAEVYVAGRPAPGATPAGRARIARRFAEVLGSIVDA